MFSRAAKSFVKSIGQRRYHAGEENIKAAMVGGAGEIGRSLSQMLKQSSKLDVLALYDVAASNKRLFSTPVRYHSFCNGEPLNPLNSRMLTMLEKSRLDKQGEALQESVGDFSARGTNLEQYKNEEIVDNIQRLPIAEESIWDQSSNSNKMSQGDNEPRGPRVLGEMGPDKFQHSGRIVSEIYRQLPNFATLLVNDVTCRGVSDASRRRFSSLATPYGELAIGRDPCEIQASKALKNASEIVEQSYKKGHWRKKDSEKTVTVCNSSLEAEKRFSSEASDLQTIERRKLRGKKIKESKIVEELRMKIEKTALRKAKNWTIPAALSDKKPKTLYGLVQQKRTSVTWFFSKLFDNQNSDDGCKYRNYKLGLNSPRMLKGIDNQNSISVSQGDRLHVSTSMSDLTSTSLEAAAQEGNKLSEVIETRHTEEKTLTSSNEDSDYDALSIIDEPQQPVRRMSSRIALFLENLMVNRKKVHSVSSVTSYNLDWLFAEEVVPALDCLAANTVLFSCKSGDSKSSFKDKLVKTFGGKKDKDKEEMCKKRQSCKKKSPECRRSADSKTCSKKAACKETRSCSQKKREPCKEPPQKPCKEPPKRDSCKEPPRRGTCKEPPQKPCKEPPKRDTCKEPPKRDTCKEPPKRDTCKEPPKRDICKEPPKRDTCKEPPQKPCKEPPKRDTCKEPPQKPCKEPPKRDTCKEPPKRDTCKEPPKRDTCKAKRTCSQKREDMCKKRDTCKPSRSCTSQKADPCKQPPKNPCKQTRSCTAQKQDPCKKSTSCTSPKKEDICKRSTSCTSQKKDACKKTASSTSQRKDTCQRSTSCTRKEDTCKKEVCKKDPCKRSTSCNANEDKCKRSTSCGSDGCSNRASKHKDPCNLFGGCQKKSPDPCKSEDSCKPARSCSPKKDPCKRTRSCTPPKDTCKPTKSCTPPKDTCKQRSCSPPKDPCQKRCAQTSEDTCKKSRSCSNEDSCTPTCDGDKDPCRHIRSEKYYGAPCKKYEQDEKFACKEDPCKKLRCEAIYGKSCKQAEDPCKKLRRPDIYGKPCKQCVFEDSKHDPCDKLWRDDVYGVRCKKDKKKKKKKKPDSCGGEKKSCEKQTKSCEKQKGCEKKSCDSEKKDGEVKKEKMKEPEKKKKGDKNKKSCPPVFRAPDCSDMSGKDKSKEKGKET